MPAGDSPWCCRAFCLPKRGHTADEYEDAYAADPESGRFAVADGASESSFAGRWARLLVEGFCESATEPTRTTEWLGPLQRRWAEEVDPLPLPWYAEEKREQGAFATFLGVVLERVEEGGWWRAVAVGDSCLFHVHGDELLAAFPVSRPEDFGNQPRLIGSRMTLEDEPRMEGTWQPGDRLFLVTDALAQWFLRQCERGGKPWQDMERSSAESNEVFAAWAEGLRDRGDVRNDDVTVVCIVCRDDVE